MIPAWYCGGLGSLVCGFRSFRKDSWSFGKGFRWSGKHGRSFGWNGIGFGRGFWSFGQRNRSFRKRFRNSVHRFRSLGNDFRSLVCRERSLVCPPIDSGNGFCSFLRHIRNSENASGDCFHDKSMSGNLNRNSGSLKLNSGCP